MIDYNKAIDVAKRFKKQPRPLNEADDAPMTDAERKQKEREKKYNQDWYNFSVTVPPEAAEFLKNQLEQFKKDNPSLFNI